jgi:short-subunit dehydrogenase
MTRNTDRPVAIVTGASRGLGKAIALKLAKDGYNLSLAARSEEAMLHLQQELANEGAFSLVTPVDLTDCEDREALVSRTMDEFGRVDVLVNNAGVDSMEKFVDIDRNDVTYQVDLNLVAPMHLSRLVLDDMVSRGSGKIVNISTLGASMQIPRLVTYGTTKSGLEHFTRALRKELKGSGVSVSAVIPGGIADTGMTRSLEARSGVRLSGPMAKGMTSPAAVASDVIGVIKEGRAEKVSAKGGAIIRAFPAVGEAMMKKVFSPIMEAAAESDEKTGRMVSDPTTEELIA